MDFLGNEKKESKQEVVKKKHEMYIPKQEEINKNKAKKEAKKQKAKEQLKVNNLEKELDLSSEYKKRQRLKKVLLIIGLVVLIVVIVIFVIYYLYNKQSKTVNLNKPKTTNVIKQPEVKKDVVIPVKQEKPNKQGVLPDTPLKPIDGSLVKFKGSKEIYLVEENGELRLVIQGNVRFDNGQTLSEINPNLIYLLPDKWKNTRRGEKNVEGQVDFDPRVLSLPELLPFL